MAVGYQSFYQAQLTSNISDTDLTIPVDVVPTPSEGFLVIESTVTNKREIIYYTSKTASAVVCPANGRGYDGTTAVDHLQGAAVIMAPVGAMFDELRSQFTTTPQGWTNMAQNVLTVTHNGNRSYDVPFASSVASILSPGMKLEFTKTVAGNGYMGGLLNGSSHYFTKTSPSGTLATVTNNFTIEATYQPTSYPATRVYIGGRADATPNNGLGLAIEPSGQITVAVFNGATANYRTVSTYQSLPLNKKTTITATWASGTVVIYFDGVSVPVQAAATGGTAPTTAGTGGDFSIGRFGAYATGYTNGYVSNFAVFDAVLSASTIKDHYTRKLTGSETNCIGAWSLDNTANDQSSAGNNLTAMGGVGYTAMSPHGQLGDGVQTTKAVALIMAVNGSTVTVQCPEGVTIPTTGGISSVAYSTQANPYGWVSDKGRWAISTLVYSPANTSGTSTSTVYNPGGLSLNVPIGAWTINPDLVVGVNTNASGVDFMVGVSTSSGSFTNHELSGRIRTNVSGTTDNIFTFYRSQPISVASMTAFYINMYSLGNFLNLYIYASSALFSMSKLVAMPSGL